MQITPSGYKFSIITPTYNRALLLPKAIQSITGQTYHNWEFIIIDDGSTDNTEEVVKKYLTDPRVRYIKKENTGGAHSRNYGASLATGDFITFLDSDDEALPRWLETVNSHLQDDTGMACVGAIKAFPDGSLTEAPPYEINAYDKKVKVRFTCGSLFVKRHVFSDIQGYDIQMPTGLQSELGYRLIEYLKNTNLQIISIEDCLVKIYFHDGPRMRTDWKSLTIDCVRFVEKFYPYFKRWDKRELANNYAVIAYYNYKLKQRRDSLLYLAKAIWFKPFDVKNYLRIIKYGLL